jgi:hypothetical protein
MPSESRTNIVGLDKKVRLLNGKNKMAANLAAILFLPFESRTVMSGFQMVKTRWLPICFNR